MSIHFQDRVAIVTGAGGGLGRQHALALARRGAKVVVNDLGTADAVADEIRAAGGMALANNASVTDEAAVAAMVKQAVDTWGRVDILVCNAASNPYYGPMAGLADEQFRKILDNNVVANHWLISFAVPQMIARRDGSIIIVSSIAGLRGTPVIGAYGISKAADMQLARNLAHEFGPHNVRVNCIAPGLIKTDFAKALWEDAELLAQRNATTPLRRIGEPDEIAGAAVFLASKAGSFMTGQSLVIDGGVTI